MVVILRCSKQFLHPTFCHLNFFKSPPKSHSDHLNPIKKHGFNIRVHHICSKHPINVPKPENGGTKNELWLYNTMSRQRELFKPKVEGKVGIYVCGIIIIARANELGEDPIYLSRRFCNEFLQDMSYLHCLHPFLEPRVSDRIPQIVDMIKQTLQDCEDVLNQHDRASLKETVPQDISSCISESQNTFLDSMSDDLHIPVVLAALSDPLKTINDFLHTRKGKKRELRVESLAALEKIIRNVLSTLGLMQSSYSEAIQQLKGLALKRAKMSEAEVLQKIEARDAARKCKDYEKSDGIRKELADVGIALMDSPQGTSWRPVLPTALQQEP